MFVSMFPYGRIGRIITESLFWSDSVFKERYSLIGEATLSSLGAQAAVAQERMRFHSSLCLALPFKLFAMSHFQRRNSFFVLAGVLSRLRATV